VLLVAAGLLALPHCSTGGLQSQASCAHGQKSSACEVTASEAPLPQGASRDWWGAVQQGIAAAEYRASENGHGLQAPNRAHRLLAHFGPKGIRLHDRAATGGPELASLSLVAAGRGAALEPVEAGTVTQAGQRVEIRRPGIVEWYENTPKGLEQGFTVAARTQGEGSLVLELSVESARARLIGNSIELASDTGRRLNYGKLIAKDAKGIILASRLEVPSPQRVQLVIEDTGASYPVLIDPLITGTADTMLQSNQPDIDSHDAAAFGGAVAIAGDVNGDGFDDVIVGARGWDLDNGLFNEGAAFVFLGSAAGLVGLDPATAHAVILGDQAAAEFGASVAGAGDVNGDGFADIIVGAPFYQGTFRGDPALSVKGAAFVFYGGPLGITATGPAMADARIDANQLDAIFGFSVAGAGDVNGDGFGDIIVGAPRQGSPTFPPNIPPNQGQGRGGAAAVFHGSAAGITASGFDDADATLLPYPAGFPVPSQQFMGSAVSGAGDVNNDGFDDVLVFIDGAALFLGSATGIVGTDPTTAHAHIAGQFSGGGFTGPGGVASGAGDVNGDGFGDIILGVPELRTFGVFLGSPVGITATDFSQAQTLVPGVGNWRVAAAGDIDNDGFDDVLVGALGFVGSLNSEGAAYVYRGGPSGIVASSELDAYVRLESDQSEAIRRLNRYDLGVGGAGDVNGDGFGDVIVGFGYYDVDQFNEGAAFVYHGGPVPPIPNQPPVAAAGPDQVFVDFDNTGSETITVDGSASFDPDGSIVTYAWLEGETLLGTSPVLTTSLVTSGDHTLVLNVTDNGGLTRGAAVTARVELVASTVQVLSEGFTSGLGSWEVDGDAALVTDTTFPDPPQVRIGASGSSLRSTIAMPAGSTGMTVSFWGKASQFAAGDELLVKLSVDGGPFTTIHTITSAASNDNYIFYGGSTIPIGHSWFPATASNIVLEFESSTTAGLFFVDLVKVKALLALPGSQPPIAGKLPIANAGADTTVDDNDSDGFELVTLDGSLSGDPDGSIATYEWFEVTSSGTSLLGTGATLDVSFARRAVPGVLGPEISGSHTVQLVVTDNAGGTASDTVVVTVNQGLAGGGNSDPVAAVNAGLVVDEGASAVIGTAQLQVTDADVGDTLTYTVTGAPASGSLNLGTSFTQAQIDANALSYTQDGSEVTSDSFTFTVSDGNGGSIGATVFAITVTPVNDNPVLAVNAGAVVAEGGSVVIGNTELQVTDPDVGDTLTYTVTSAPASGSLNLGTSFTQAQIDANALSYTQDGSELASDSFTFTVSDANGGSIGATVFAITVTPVNDNPVLAVNAGAVVAEGGSVVIGSAQLQVTDADPGTTLTFTVTSAPSSGALNLGSSFTQAQIDAGALNYTQDGSEVTSDAFSFTVSDGNGGSIGSTVFAITVTPVNDAPSLGLASLPDATEGVLYSVLITPSDPDPGDVLSVTLVGGPGWLEPPVDNGNGTWTLAGVPQPGDAGNRVVTLRVTDSGTPVLDEQLALDLLVLSSGPVAVPTLSFWLTCALMAILATLGAHRATSGRRISQGSPGSL